MQLKLLMIFLTTALFQGANGCSVDAHTSPSVDGQQSNQHHGKQSYTLIFCKGGVSKGDVSCDKSATLIGSADTVLSTSPDSLKFIRGGCAVVAAEHDIKIELPGSDSVTVSAHSRVELSKMDDKIAIHVTSGNAKIRTVSEELSLSSGANLIVEKGSIHESDMNAAPNFDFSKSRSKNGFEPVRLLANDGTKFAIKNGQLWLKNVSAFVELPAGVDLVTPGGTISSASSSMISCRLVDDAMCIENCSPVTVVDMSVNGDKFKLAPFKCCSLKNGDDDSVNLPDDGVLRRDVIAQSDGKVTKIISEYDPLSLIEAHSELKKAVSKPITFHQQRASELLFKSIAVFEELCGDVDSFEENPDMQVRRVKGRIASASSSFSNTQ